MAAFKPVQCALSITLLNGCNNNAYTKHVTKCSRVLSLQNMLPSTHTSIHSFSIYIYKKFIIRKRSMRDIHYLLIGFLRAVEKMKTLYSLNYMLLIVNYYNYYYLCINRVIINKLCLEYLRKLIN